MHVVSDEERREVAAQMREIMRRSPNCFLENMVVRSVLDVMGEGMTIGETVAALIDRPTCRKRIPDEMEGLVFCSNCGAEIGEYSVPNYCPNCGRQVVK